MEPKPEISSQIDYALADVCQKKIVFLGEDAAHGSGRTLEIKALLATRLMQQCGFNAVFFESQVYDFVDYERSVKLGTATREELYDAIGGLWSTTTEIESFVNFLFEKTARGQAKVAGLDPQIGGATQLFTSSRLPRQVTEGLREPLRGTCEASISRLTKWEFSDASPYGDAARADLSFCVQAIIAIDKLKLDEDARRRVFMAENLSHYLNMSGEDAFLVRETSMYENFNAAMTLLDPSAKVIVWGASVHFARSNVGRTAVPSFGSRVRDAMGDRVAVIAFSAASGSYGRQNQPPHRLMEAPLDSLEGRVMSESSSDLRYIDHEQLRGAGVVPCRALSYATWTRALWSEVFDGMLVVHTERPPAYVREPIPMQIP